METTKEIEQIDNVISRLKLLKSSLLKVEKLSDKAYNMSTYTHTAKQINNAAIALNSWCIELDRCRRKAWQAIKEAEELEVSLEVPEEYFASGFHKIKNR